MNIIFCNVAYMEHYDIEIVEEIPKHGGQYVIDTGDALEKYNFHICDDGKCRGFVETKYRDSYKSGKQPNAIRIENINPLFKNKASIDDVTVVFCAHSDTEKKTVIVGWYNNASVLRNREKYNGREYNLICNAKDAHRIEVTDRKFSVPRAVKSDFGFGQANVWYAKEDKASDYVKSVLDYIERNENALIVEDETMPQIVPKEYVESGIGKDVKVNRYERNAYARRKCLEEQGTKCIICGFDAEKIYGAEFKDRIEVHHIVPINEIKTDYKVDPTKDIVPVCPNCHMMLHTKLSDGKYPTIDYLKSIIK